MMNMYKAIGTWAAAASAGVLGILALDANPQARSAQPGAVSAAQPATSSEVQPQAQAQAMPPFDAMPAAFKPVAPKPAASRPAAPKPVDQNLVVKRVLAIDGPFKHGDYVWDAEGVTEGALVITVDLAAQTMSVFRGGYEIGAAVILYGADDSQSPLGVFPITEKDADHVSNLYDAPMPYMLRLTNDGIAIHGSDVELDAATRGCIGVPTPFAKLLFAQAKRGDRVIITKGERLALGGTINTV